MAGAIQHLGSFLGQNDPNAVMWHALHDSVCQAVRARVAAKYSPATANRYLSALRGVLRQAWRLGLMSTDA
jgi:integrase/recombinase XerC